jgi:hypothetical protein
VHRNGWASRGSRELRVSLVEGLGLGDSAIDSLNMLAGIQAVAEKIWTSARVVVGGGINDVHPIGTETGAEDLVGAIDRAVVLIDDVRVRICAMKAHFHFESANGWFVIEVGAYG